MARTPSKGIDQNQGGKFIDKYWGRVPQFLKFLPEAYICEVNPEYLDLMEAYMSGSINLDNISDELFDEVENIMINIGCECLLTGKERMLLEAYQGNSYCEPPSDKLICTDTICCNSWVRCSPLSVCGPSIP